MQIRPIDGPDDWEAARSVRQRVFVEEQACPPEEEWDEHDATSRHFVGEVDGRTAATARWRAVPFEGRIAAKLERFAVLPEHRGHGYGRRLVGAVRADAQRAGFDVFVLHAQAHLQAFYEGLGFEATDVRFEEAGIPHVKMVQRLADPAG